MTEEQSAHTWLGIDCGTSKVAVVVIDEHGYPLHVDRCEHTADLQTLPNQHEQNAEQIIAVAEQLVASIPLPLRQQLRGVGFTGQMHGVVLHDECGNPRSPLVTWQDQRLSDDDELRQSLAPHLRNGFGMATLAWWKKSGELSPDKHAATIHGLLAARWCGAPRAVIDPTDAHAWGGLDAVPDLSADLLPLPVSHGAQVGVVSSAVAQRLKLPLDTAITAPLGDNQASVRATIVDPKTELACTIGTGCQLVAIVPRDTDVDLGVAERRPYTADSDIIVAAPLCGGAAWRWFAERCQQWISEMGVPPPTLAQVYERLDDLGLAATDTLTFAPHLAGERHAPTLSAALSGLRLESGSLGEIARAVARGIVVNAFDMMPQAVLQDKVCVRGSGNALRQSRLLCAMTEAVFGLPLMLSPMREEAAIGAALVASNGS